MNDIVTIMKAADFAARKHANQKRKGEVEEPYLNHLIEVATLVAEATDGRPEVVVAALLHDAVEDQDVTNTEIAGLFGPTVASLVAELTDDKSLLKQERKDKQIAAASHKSEGASVRQDKQPARHRQQPAAVARGQKTGLCRMGEGRRLGPARQASRASGALRGS